MTECPICGVTLPCSKHKPEVIAECDSLEQAQVVRNAAEQMDQSGKYGYKIVPIDEDN